MRFQAMHCVSSLILCSLMLFLVGCAATSPPPPQVVVSIPQAPPVIQNQQGYGVVYKQMTPNYQFTKSYLECLSNRNIGCIYYLAVNEYRQNNNLNLCEQLQHRDGQTLAFVEASICYNDRKLYEVMCSEIRRCVSDEDIVRINDEIQIIASEDWAMLVDFFHCYSFDKRDDCLNTIAMYPSHYGILSKYFSTKEDGQN